MSGTKLTLLLFCGLLAYLSVSKSRATPSNGDLRLTGYGSTALWGRLEIYLKNRWGTICDTQFGITEAEVACRQMGLGYSVNYRASPYQRHGLANSVVHLRLSCAGTESHVLNCAQARILNSSCTHLDDIEIICSDWKPWPYSGEIRLVGGTTASEGYVEMYLNGEWGRICSDSMSGDEANVMCRQLGYDSAVSYTPKDGDDLGSGGYSALNITGPMLTGNTIWYNDVLNCVGNEVCLARCLSSIPSRPVDSCSSEVGVRCTHGTFQSIRVGSKSVCEVNSTWREKSVRLVGGRRPYIGRLEVFHNNEWGVICADTFRAAEGHVACRQLGYSVIFNYATVTLSDNPVVHYREVDCKGAESSFADCRFIDATSPRFRCRSGRFATIYCYNRPYPPLASVRMLGGSGPYGVIEVFNGARWGPICDERFDLVDGDVVCRQFGYTGALRIMPNSYLGVGRNFIHMTDVRCNGNESHLWSCPFTNTTNIKCNYYNQVAVHCGSNSSMLYGALRLTGGDNSTGRLEINFDGIWGTVCKRNFAEIDGHVACRQLGFKGVISVSNVTNAWANMTNLTIFLNEVHCKGYEEKLMDCRHRYGDNVCTHDEDVLLTCDTGLPDPDGKLRLVDGISPNRGRLEIVKDGLWGSVCSFHFDKTDADVACRQMGFNYAVKILENFGGGSDRPINIHNITCFGNESKLIDCEHEVYTYFYCDPSENVGIICDALPSNGDLRLAGYGSTALWGRVEIYLNDTWGTICDDTFRLTEANVACRQMGLGAAVNYRANPLQRHGLANSTVHFSLSCNGSETHVLNCQQLPIINESCSHRNDIEIICSEWKPQPYSGQIRLVGGTAVSEGLVQMYLNGEWGRVCSENNISSNEANVICRQLGYDSAVSYQPRDETISESDYATLKISSFGEITDTIWFSSNLNCSGSEFCLTSCLSSIPTSPLGQCSNEVGVRCTHNSYQKVDVGNKSVCEIKSATSEKTIRLVGSNVPHLGAIEVFYNNTWGAICFDNFYAAEGHIACRDLGYSGIARYASVRINETLLHFYEVDCKGTEHSFRECNFVEQVNQRCIFGRLAGVHCIDVAFPPLASVRMLGGSGPYGVAEIFNGNRWGPICDGDFDQEDGDIFCRQLGFTGALRVIPNSYLGVARNPLLITYLKCDGDEKYLWDCDFNNTDNSDFICDFYNQIAIHCGSNSSMMYGALRLTGGNSSFGRLEINLDDSWGSVCSFGFGSLDGHVACRQLGFKGVQSISVNSSWANRTNHTVFLTSVRCQGYEDMLINCRHDFGENICTSNADVLLYCDTSEPELDGALRLADKISPTSGRLEILKDGLWGTICSYHFDVDDANVACRQLGYAGAAQVFRNHGGGSDLPINIHEINCDGSEDRLIDCDQEVYTHFYCHHSENVAIACDVPVLTRGRAANGDFRLAGDGSTLMVGRLEMYSSGEWGTVCGRKFGMAEAHVACRQLGNGYAASFSFNQRYGWSNDSIKLEIRSCVGNESFLLDCHHHLNPSGCSHMHDVNLVCTKWPSSSSLRNGKVRLTGGATSSEGFVEVYGGNNNWYRICGSFELKEGNATCKQLGYTGIRASVYAPPSVGENILVVNSSCKINEVNGFCLGSTSSCFSTSTNCSDGVVFIKCVQGRRKPVEVIPQCNQAINYNNDLRLYNGTDSSGILQIYDEDESEWGNLCGDNFTKIEGEIACRQLGFSALAKITLSQWSDLNVLEPATINISECSGLEDKLSDCVWGGLDVSLVCNSGIVNLECSNKKPPFNSARLSGGAGSYGAIQRYNGHQWKGFCGTDNTEDTLQYYYKEMGYVNGSLLDSGPRCPNDERHFQKCLANNGTHKTCRIVTETVIYAQLDATEDIKQGSIMISNGNYTAGVLQVYYNGSWIDVCSDMDTGNVACRQLGFYSILGVHDDLSAIGLGKGQKQSDGPMAKYKCVGNEQNLNDCSLDVDENACQLPASSIITCNFENGKTNGLVRLTDGGYNYGRLEIAIDGYWGTVCSTNFDRAAADVACKQLGFDESFNITKNFGGGKFMPVFVNGTNCTGYESQLADCSSISSSGASCDYTQNVAIGCDDIICQPLPDVNNGGISCSLGGDGIPSLNDTCDFTCDKGYLLGGSSTRTCLRDKSWSGTDVECVKVLCSPLDIVNGSINCFLGPSKEDICNVTCNKGYILVGSDTRTCLHNGSWSGIDGSCKLVSCPPSPNITNGNLVCSQGADGLSHFEDSCTLTCSTGYTMVDGTVPTCQLDSTWSSMDAECRRVNCQQPTNIDNGNVKCSLGDDGVHSYQDTCTVTCNSGYTLTGSGTGTCQSDGNWSGLDGTCNRVKCQELSKFDNGNFNCSLGDDGVHSYQDNCSITCNEGYILTGDETKTCQSDGSWSGIDAMCKRVKCQELSKFDNGNVNCSLGDDGVHSYQDNCSITCNVGYILTGDETKTCQSDGSWSGIDAMCKRVKCENISKIDNGDVKCSLGDDGVHSYEDTCTVTCNPGYTLTSNGTRTCQSDGSWSGIVAVCRKDVVSSTVDVPVVTSSPNSSSNTKSNDGGSSAGLAVGVILGILCVIGIIVIIIVVIVYLKRRHDKNGIAHRKFLDEDEADLVKHSADPITYDNPTYENPGYELD